MPLPRPRSAPASPPERSGHPDASRRPAVLHVITRLARGGSERRLFDAVRAVEADHVVVVGSGSDPEAVASLDPSVEVLHCADLVRELDPRRDLAALRWLARLVREREFAVVHTHQSKAGLLGRVAARARRDPVVIHSASMASFGPGYGRSASIAFALAERVTVPLVHRYLVVGSDLADRLAANGVPARKLTVVRSSLDLAPFRPASVAERSALRARRGVHDDVAVIAFVGSLDRRKGVDRLAPILRAALQPASDLPDRRGDVAASARPGGAATPTRAVHARLVVAGDGPLGGLLADAAGAVPGLEVAMLGHVEDVASVIRASDLLVLPSSAEGLPQVVVQAAAAEVPVVAYDVDGVGELAALGATVAIARLGEEAAFVDAVRAGLAAAGRTRLHTDGEPDRGGLLAAGVLDEWQPERVAGQYRAVYREALGGRFSGRRGASARWGWCGPGSPAR